MSEFIDIKSVMEVGPEVVDHGDWFTMSNIRPRVKPDAENNG
mgnify:CR=1 FL=1